MGESHPGPATTPDCQLLTEQPSKDLQTMGFRKRRGRAEKSFGSQPGSTDGLCL
jgi:hypothetical protein